MGFVGWALHKLGYAKQNRETTPAGTIEKAFGVLPAWSRRMEDNIGLWWAMYIDHPPWETGCVRPLGLPGAIGRDLARHALAEFFVAVSGSARAEYLNRQLQGTAPRLSTYLELGLCLGGVALKPYPDGERILVDAFTTRFTPTRFDGTGRAIGGVFESGPVRQGREWFKKLECHGFQARADGSTVYVVENTAHRSGPDGGLGPPVPLAAVREWAGLEERIEIENLDGPLFAYFKPPAANSIEPGSPLGVSVYAGPTVDLIRQADCMWEKLFWEYDSAERKILVDRAQAGADQAKDRLFEYGTFNQPDFFQFLNPEIRDGPFYQGFQHILQRIEFNVGLAYGSISDPQSVEKTATEILAAKQRQFVTEKAIQAAFQAALEDLLYAMDAWSSLAQLAPAGAYHADYNWGDGVLDDPETKRQDMAMDMQRVAAGLMKPVSFVMKWDGVDEETARKLLPDMEDMTTQPEEELE